MKKISALALSLLVLIACKKDETLTFSEFNALYQENAIIELNIPKANGSHHASESINKTIDNHIANSLNFSEDDSESITLDQAIEKFQSEYISFKNDFEESALVWEATFDGEIIYQSPELISMALSNYTNTGGAHGNSNITLYNFDTQNGQIIENEDLISNMDGFTDLVKTYFKKEASLNSDTHFEDYFFGDDFHLPANIGFNDEGILILYNVYEIASYAQGITEFTIPMDQAKPFLKIF